MDIDKSVYLRNIVSFNQKYTFSTKSTLKSFQLNSAQKSSSKTLNNSSFQKKQKKYFNNSIQHTDSVKLFKANRDSLQLLNQIKRIHSSKKTFEKPYFLETAKDNQQKFSNKFPQSRQDFHLQKQKHKQKVLQEDQEDQQEKIDCFKDYFDQHTSTMPILKQVEKITDFPKQIFKIQFKPSFDVEQQTVTKKSLVMKLVDIDDRSFSMKKKDTGLYEDFKFGVSGIYPEMQEIIKKNQQTNKIFKNFNQTVNSQYPSETDNQQDNLNLNKEDLLLIQQSLQNKQYEPIYPQLKKIQFFQELPEEKSLELLKNAQYLQIEKNEQLYHNNTQYVYIILIGYITLQIPIEINGKSFKKIIQSSYDGQLFGNKFFIKKYFPIDYHMIIDIFDSYDLLKKRKDLTSFQDELDIIEAIALEKTHLLRVDLNFFQSQFDKISQPQLLKEISFLKEIDLFKYIPEFYLIRIFACLEKIHYKKGDIIIQQNEQMNHLYLIENGCAKLFYEPNLKHKWMAQAQLSQKNKDLFRQEPYYPIRTISVGDYFGQRTLLSGYDTVLKQKTFKKEFFQSYLRVECDTPKLTVYRINRNNIDQSIQDVKVFRYLMKQIVQTEEFDNYNQKTMENDFLSYIKQIRLLNFQAKTQGTS